MKKADVKVGATFRAKVSSNVVEVRIDAESPHGGWDATNLATGKKVRIKSAQRLRPNVAAAKAPKAASGEVATTAAPAAKDAAAGPTAAPEAKDATPANVGPPAPKAKNPARAATEKARKEAIKVADANLAAIEAAENGAKPKSGKGKRGRSKPDFSKAVKPTFPKPRRTSALDAAAQILAKATEPMTCKAIVAAMAEQGLWSSPGGKTPEATLNAAIIREIGKKRKEARFIKAGRGLFAHSGQEG